MSWIILRCRSITDVEPPLDDNFRLQTLHSTSVGVILVANFQTALMLSLYRSISQTAMTLQLHSGTHLTSIVCDPEHHAVISSRHQLAHIALATLWPQAHSARFSFSADPSHESVGPQSAQWWTRAIYSLWNLEFDCYNFITISFVH